jgi:hypothetical protein
MLSACPCFCPSPCAHVGISSNSTCSRPSSCPSTPAIFILGFFSRLMFLSLDAAILVILHTLLRLLCRSLSRLRSTMVVTHLLLGGTASRLNLLPVETYFGCVIAVEMKGDTVVKSVSSIHRLLNYLGSKHRILRNARRAQRRALIQKMMKPRIALVQYNGFKSAVVNDSKKTKQISCQRVVCYV